MKPFPDIFLTHKLDFSEFFRVLMWVYNSSTLTNVRVEEFSASFQNQDIIK